MRGGRPEPAAPGRARRLAPWLLLAAATLGGLALGVHGYYDATYDGSMYLVCARSMLSGEGYAYLGDPFRIRPPGFSALLVPVLAVWGTDFLVLNVAVALFGVLLALALFALERPRCGTAVALAFALWAWSDPPLQRLCYQTLSDVPATALLFACLLVERAVDARAARPGAARRELLLGAAIGLASYVRTVDLLLVPAVVGARLLRGRGELPWRTFVLRRLALPALGAALVLAPWVVRDATTDFPTVPDQHPLHSYAVAQWRVDKGDPGSPYISAADLGRRFRERGEQVLAALGSGLAEREPTPRDVALGVVLLAATAASFLRRRGTAEAFALGTALVLSIYFGFAPRLVLPVWLVAAAAAVRWIQAGLERAAGARGGSALLAAALVGLAAWNATRWDHAERARAVHERYVNDALAAAPLLPPEGPVATSIGHHYSAVLGRDVYSFRIAVKREADWAAVDEILERHGVRAVFLFEGVPTDRPLLRHFEERFGPPLENGRARAWRLP